MNTCNSENKVISLSQAITRYVTKDCHISIGGFTVSRNPMAAVHEIIRQKIIPRLLKRHAAQEFPRS